MWYFIWNFTGMEIFEILSFNVTHHFLPACKMMSFILQLKTVVLLQNKWIVCTKHKIHAHKMWHFGYRQNWQYILTKGENGQHTEHIAEHVWCGTARVTEWVWCVAECVWCVAECVWCVAECVCGVTGVLLSVLLSVCAMVFSVSQCVTCVPDSALPFFQQNSCFQLRQFPHTRERMGLWFWHTASRSEERRVGKECW